VPRFFSFLICLIILYNSTEAQDKKISLLDEGFYFEPLLFDPTESLSGAGIFNLWENNEDATGIYVPVNIALHHSLIRYKADSITGWEFGLQAAAFTQFEIKQVDDGAYLGGMVNVDYRAVGFISYRKKRTALRLRLFHISSHLADDYIIRNNITSPTPNTLNYEQLDLTGSFAWGSLRPYAGFGYIFTPNSIRERWSFQAGVQYQQANREEKFARLMAGFDIKFFEENEYTPGFRAGAGVQLGQPHKTHVGLLLDFYHGHLPYSTMEYRRVTWFGISSILIPKRLNF
jgi:hypothetical protein